MAWRSENRYLQSYCCFDLAGYRLYMVMYMSSIASIPESFYEAAALVGANKWVQVQNHYLAFAVE